MRSPCTTGTIICRKHQTLGTTPAVAAGIATEPMLVDDLVKLLADEERIRARGGRINRADKT